MRVRALLVTAAAMAVWCSAADAAPVRIFAIGNKQRIADAVSYQTYRNKMSALMDAGFPSRSNFVQAGVDDVASHLRSSDPNAPATAMVVFPEDVGLITALIGSRGAAARQQTTAAGAIGSLLGPYTPQRNYYDAKYPGQPPIRTLILALTDTFYRSFYETFRSLAVKHKVYLAAAINAAPARRVTDPALVSLLRDPDEPDRSYAYEAVSPYPTNSTYVFGPGGEIIGSNGRGGTRRSPSQTGGVIQASTKKAYLVPIEQPPPGEPAGLSLGFGAVRDLEVLNTPAGRLGIVISKDAWMVDVNDRFATKGANVILQPEAFSAWAYYTDPWEPDIFKEGGFANLQKLPRFLANVNASMTGNFFDVTFDGQSAILRRKRKIDPRPLSPANAWIGQNPDTGFRVIAPWIRRDPGISNPSLTLAQRRSMLAAAGSKLQPGSGVPCANSLAVGACENGYREAIVWADVPLPEGPVSAPVDRVRATPPRFDRSVRVSAGEPAPVSQQAPRVAAVGSRVYVVWQTGPGGLGDVRLAVSEDGGATFGPPIRVSDNARGVAELHPTVAARADQVVVAWQEYRRGRNDDVGRIKLARFDAQGHKFGRDTRVDDSDQGGKWLPQVALVGPDPGTPVVVWIDERDRGPQDLPLEHVYAARANDVGPGFAPSVRVDAGAPVPLAAHLDNKWSPTITAADGRVYVAWADFRNYNWDIFFARSDNQGRTFGPNVRIDDYPDFERLNERPTLGVSALGAVHAAWTDLRARQPDTNIFYARSDDRGASFSANRQLDDSKLGFDPNRDTPTNQWHPSLAAVGANQLFVAWQDNRRGNNDIFFTTSGSGGAAFARSERVDDTGGGASEQSRPHLAWAAGRCYVVWEDNRNGTSDIFLGRRQCPRQ
jgi:hypothetical protein